MILKSAINKHTSYSQQGLNFCLRWVIIVLSDFQFMYSERQMYLQNNVTMGRVAWRFKTYHLVVSVLFRKKPLTEAVRRMQSYNEHILKMPIMNVSTCNIVNIVNESRIHSTKLFSLFFSCQVFLSSPYAKIYLPQFFSKRPLA